MRSILIIAALLAVAVTAFPTQPAEPIIGIVTHPLDQCETPPSGTFNACVESYYVRWVEAAGARVVAVPFNATWEVQKWWLDRINGVLFQGGGLSGARWLWYLSMADRIYKYAIERKAAGDPFVIWGTCQGFQVLACCASGNPAALEGPYPNMYPAMLPINFTLAQPTSRMLGDARAPSRVRHVLQTKATTLNWHHEIVKTEAWKKYPSMKNLRMLSTNVVPGYAGDVEFASAYEADNAEIYAVQFHPERPPYEFSNDIIAHDADTIAVSEYLANFIVSRLRLNNHSFDNATQAEANRIGQWPLIEQGWGTETYYINDVNAFN